MTLHDQYVLQIHAALREEILERQRRSFKVITSAMVGVPTFVFAGRFFEEMYAVGTVFLLLAPVAVVISGFF